MSASLAGTGTLIRFFLRKDRIKLPAWLAGFALFVAYVGSAIPTIAPEQSDLAGMAPIFSQPVGRMFTGPAFGMDAPTYERFFAAGYAPYLFVLAALMTIMLVTRHTRAEEQAGRAELLRANVTGRHAGLTAALWSRRSPARSPVWWSRWSAWRSVSLPPGRCSWERRQR